MDVTNKEQRDRLFALGAVSLLLILVYGPAAGWFVGADRLAYDLLVRHVPSPSLEDGAIVTINPRNRPALRVQADYGRVLRALRELGAARIVLPNPPEFGAAEALPEWAASLDGGPPVFVPMRHPLAAVATRAGYQDLRPDEDGVLRRSNLWYLNDGVMSPSLPLAVALASTENLLASRVARNDAVMHLSSYRPLPRIAAAELLTGRATEAAVAGKTVFLDADLPIASAAARLPSGQYVTPSEVAAALLADIESGRVITVPSWAGVMEILLPAVLAGFAVLLLPGRSRHDILLVTAAAGVALLTLEALLLALGGLRLDLGRPLVVVAGASLFMAMLAGTRRKPSEDALKRGCDFLAAGRLEPAFAEFRRCKPTESLANVLYKLSLAFEEQANPERAEAVLNWLKQSQRERPRPRPGAGASLKSTSGDVPRQLGRYVIEKQLGRGAMGAVYLARDPRINRPVALKIIPIEKEFEDEELKEARLRFFREAESAGRLTHPNIITVYDCGEDQHLAYIAMEYLEGTPLTYFKAPQRLLAPRTALELCARTADALDYAHNQGVIHRDIKPANLLYNSRNDVLKISDFGVARLTDNNRTKTGIVLGTPMYMSPEQLGAEKLTGHSDLFSLGVTLYELLAGEVPFKATNIAQLMKKITSADPAPVSKRRPGVPPSVDAVLFRALAKRSDDRFANGAEMAIALRNCARYASA